MDLNLKNELRTRAKILSMDYVDLAGHPVDERAFEQIGVEDAIRLNVAPLYGADDQLRVAVCEPENMVLENQICRIVGTSVEILVAAPDEIRSYLKRADSSGQLLQNVVRDFQPKLLRESTDGGEDLVDFDAVVGETGIVRLLNSILMAALEKKASDIHIELSNDQIDLKYRIDGLLRPAADQIDARFHEEIVSRIKVLAELDIAEQRVPQDGRFRVRFAEREVDFRVSVLPTQFGEDVVIRILDRASVGEDGSGLKFENLGFGADDLKVLRRSIRQPFGLLLITGPTGSGKTTTLYSALAELNDGDQKLITIEDPIEYQLPNVVQIPVNEKKKLTFASGLRSILRHDPDKIMVGEIRDKETAEIAIQAALTGHLVIASVHANNSFDVVSRFTHWGIDLHDFVSALNAVFAQRLFRKLCPECKTPTSVSGQFEARGCVSCGHTGHSGRIAALEYLLVDEEIAELIVNRSIFGALKEARARKGMRDIDNAGMELVNQGRISLNELERIVGVHNVE